MRRIQLIHWNEEEAEARAQRLRAMGYKVAHQMPGLSVFLRQLGEKPPDAIVIDLGRLPSQGSEVGLHLRKRKATRHIPLLFVGGAPEKVARAKSLLPDAVYASWETISDALNEAIAAPPADPVVPASTFQAYAGKPLVEKLGIKEQTAVKLVGAPEDFAQTLGNLPKDASLHREEPARWDLTIWFTRSMRELKDGASSLVTWAAQGPVWIAWPKKASTLATDLTQQDVREMGLAMGLVDYKICAIDKTWSGLLFTQRKSRA